MLKDDLKKRAMESMKAKDSAATQLFRLALGEVQMLEVRSGKDATDDDVAAVVRKLVKSNEETRAMSEDPGQKEALTREIELLQAVLPKGLGVAEIVVLLEPVRADILAAKSDGQATGLAVKQLKASGISAGGNDVALAVREIRQ